MATADRLRIDSFAGDLTDAALVSSVIGRFAPAAVVRPTVDWRATASTLPTAAGSRSQLKPRAA